MNMPPPCSHSVTLLATTLAVFLCSPPARSAEAAPPWPSGIVDFAGRAARNHWYLFGAEKRADLEALNRELREAQQQLDKARDDDMRRAATDRGTAAASRLLEIVKACPRRIRVDLTTEHPMLAPNGPFELPGETGALLFEVVSGG